MSRLSRGVFDKLRRWGLPSATLPYDSGEWWDSSYGRSDGHPIEWGGVGFADLAAPGGRRGRGAAGPTRAPATPPASRTTTSRARRRSGGSLLVLGGGTVPLAGPLRRGLAKVLDYDISPEAVKQPRPGSRPSPRNGRARPLAATPGATLPVATLPVATRTGRGAAWVSSWRTRGRCGPSATSRAAPTCAWTRARGRALVPGCRLRPFRRRRRWRRRCGRRAARSLTVAPLTVARLLTARLAAAAAAAAAAALAAAASWCCPTRAR